MCIRDSINPVLSFGFEKFCEECANSGVSGLIIPDLPPIEFERNYQPILEKYGLNFTFLVTPETSEAVSYTHLTLPTSDLV